MNDIARFLGTYFERPAFRILALGTLLCGLAWLVILLAAYQGWFKGSFDNSVVFILLAFLVYLSPFVLLTTFVIVLAWHVRVQMSHSGIDVVPDFRRVHLRVAVLVFASVFIGIILLINLIAAIAIAFDWARNPNPYWIGHIPAVLREIFRVELGWMTVVLTFMTVIAACASFRSPWYGLLVLPLGVLLLTTSNFAKVFEIIFEPVNPFGLLSAAGFVLADCCVLFIMYDRLARISEPRSVSRSAGMEKAPRTALPMPVELGPHRVLPTPLARAWHRRHGVISPFAPWLVGAVLSALLVAVVLIAGAKESDLLRSVLLPTLVPGVVISLVWRERWMNLGYESLYPAGRGEFVQELLTATAFSLMELWIATALAVLPPILIQNPHFLATPMFVVTLVASAAMQFMVFGIMFLSALYRPMLPYVNVITILAQLIPISFAWAENPELSQRGLLAVAGIEMAIGVAITMLGYATWRRADLA